MPQLDEVTLLALSLFGSTALLLMAAYWFGQTRTGRVMALSSIATVCGANYAMMLSYQGEKELFYERAGPIERRAIQRRGSFEYVDREDGGGAAGGSNGSEQTASAGGTAADEGGAGGEDAQGSGASRGASGLLARLFSQLSTAGFAQQSRLRPKMTIQDCDDCPEMVIVEPGYFRMGAAAGDSDAQPSEHPQRMVKVSRRFAIGRTEVTVAQYAAFAKATGRVAPACDAPRTAPLPDDATGCVTWHDAVAYAAWLNTITGRSYRLPTEVEWEWAARGGSEGRYISGHVPSPQGINGYGLLNVHGGVAEIVDDCWAETLASAQSDASRPNRAGDCRRRVLRDAGSNEPAILARLSARRPFGLYEQRHSVGFRIARDL